MTRLDDALRRYTQRSQFHCHTLLNEVIAAVREEEQQKMRTLVEAARAIVGVEKQT